MKAGPVEFLPKPFDEQEWPSAIETAIVRDRLAREKRSELARVEKPLWSAHSPRAEVLAFVAGGFLNKQTVADVGTSEITIRVHRDRIMRKMGARCLLELVRMPDKLS
jgi:FixJ family two-component response regulator